MANEAVTTSNQSQIIVPEVVQGYMERLVDVINKLDDAKKIVDDDVLAPLSVDAEHGAAATTYHGNASSDLVEYFNQLSVDINRLANMVYKLYLYMEENVEQAKEINKAADTAAGTSTSGAVGGAFMGAGGGGAKNADMMIQ